VRILIVEDDERIVSFMKRGLEAEAHEVDISSGKSQTFALTAACTYDVIILDIFLGPDDGLDICQALKQRGVKSSILLMTAKGTAEIEKMSKNAGADAYLSKPFSFDDLLETLTRLGASSISPDRLMGTVSSQRALQEKIADAFTNSDPPRPTSMTVSEMDMRGCFSMNMNRRRKQS
jgi:DNA-binding response OmpR family regulator